MGNEGLGLQVAVLQEHATSPSLKRVKEVALNTPTTFVKYHRGIQHVISKQYYTFWLVHEVLEKVVSVMKLLTDCAHQFTTKQEETGGME